MQWAMMQTQISTKYSNLRKVARKSTIFSSFFPFFFFVLPHATEKNFSVDSTSIFWINLETDF